jgi:hypothetical protein
MGVAQSPRQAIPSHIFLEAILCALRSPLGRAGASFKSVGMLVGKLDNVFTPAVVMSLLIDELLNLVPPPAHPINAKGDWGLRKRLFRAPDRHAWVGVLPRSGCQLKLTGCTKPRRLMALQVAIWPSAAQGIGNQRTLLVAGA